MSDIKYQKAMTVKCETEVNSVQEITRELN